MSIASDRIRIENAKSDFETWLTSKEIEVPSGSKLDDLVALLPDNVGSNLSTIIVTAETGSTVTASLGDTVKTAIEDNGTWTFTGCDIGTWVITATKGDETATESVVIAEDGQLFRYNVTLTYFTKVIDFDWASYGVLNTDYEILDDTDNALDESEWSTAKNWKARLLTSGTLIPLRGGSLDVFLVGGGGNNAETFCAGAGGGYTRTEKNVDVSSQTEYPIVIGGSAGSTSAFGFEASPGGSPSKNGGTGGSGGSGGGAYSGGEGGSDGSNGSYGTITTGAYPYGMGQGTTTREFGEETGRLYAGGGGGGVYTQTPGTGGAGGGGNCNANGAANTGGGAGGTNYSAQTRCYGGSGIVVIRAARGQTNG